MRDLLKKSLLMLGVFILMLGMPGQIRAEAAAAHQVTAKAVSSSKIQLTWSSAEGADRYAVYRSTSAENGFQKLKTVSGSLSYTDTGVAPAVVYYYRVVPVNSASGDEIENAAMAIKAKTPAKVQISRLAVKSPTKIQLFWNISAGSSGYEIYRAGSRTGNYQKIADIEGKNTDSYVDSKVMPGKTYYYKIRPTNQNGGTFGAGSYSDPVKGKTVAKAVFTSITSVDSKTMRFTWKKVSGASSYEIYRSTKKDSGYKRIATVKGSARKYTDKTVTSGKKYFYKIVTIGMLDGRKITSGYSQAAGYRALQQVKISSVKSTKDESLKVSWKKVTGATEYKLYRGTSLNGSYKKIATVKASGALTQSYTDKKVSSGKKYYYKVQAYSSDDGLILAGSGSRSEAKMGSTDYAIMGETTVTADQMQKLFEASGRSYPSGVYKDKGAKNLKKFCQIVIDESEKEGVRAEVIFAQICLETGYLQFGGQVGASQCNFAGLGATDDGAAGATFPNVKIGIRAQVQHLKGYASTDSLNQSCVDPRFVYLSSRRGTAKYVQSLGGGNWATDPNYASKLMNLIKIMKNY